MYKYKAFISTLYSTIDNPKRPNLPFICEHVLFNKQISEYGKLYICKELRPLYEPIKSFRTVIGMLYQFLRFK